MFSLVSRASFAALAVLLGAGLSSAAQAADMPFFPPPAEEQEQPVEWGTGWYLRGDVGFTDSNAPVVFTEIITGNPKSNAISAGGGIGYQFNSWFRGEIAVDRQIFRAGSGSTPVWCPYTSHPATRTYFDPNTNSNVTVNVGAAKIDNETCTPYASSHVARTSGFINGYFDLGNWYGFTPYVGAGVGLSLLRSNGSLNYYKNSDGSLYSADLSVGMDGFPHVWVDGSGNPIADQSIPFAAVNWNRNVSKSSYKFAWNVMAGFSYDLTQNVKIDVGYRYLNAGSYTSNVGTGPLLPLAAKLMMYDKIGNVRWGAGGPTVTRDMTSHEIRLGVRLTAD